MSKVLGLSVFTYRYVDSPRQTKGSAIEIAEAYRKKKKEEEKLLREEERQKAKKVAKMINAQEHGGASVSGGSGSSSRKSRKLSPLPVSSLVKLVGKKI